MNSVDRVKIIEGIKSKDPMTFEEAFHLILPIVDEYKTELLNAMHREPEAKTKAKFIELLGYCKDESLIQVFQLQLASKSDDVIVWSLFALENNPSQEGAKIAREFRKKTKNFLTKVFAKLLFPLMTSNSKGATRLRDSSTLHSEIAEGVEIDVIKIGDDGFQVIQQVELVELTPLHSN